MTKQYTDDEIERVKASIDLVSFIERDGVKLKKSGQWYMGMCPFHANSKTEAFGVKANGTWQCFANCCDGGDVISYVRKRSGCSFNEAVAELAGGVVLPALPPPPPRRPASAIAKERRVFKPIAPKPTNLAQWQAYNPCMTGELVDGYGLSVGVLAVNKCKHERLLVPMKVNGVTLARRGRIIKATMPEVCQPDSEHPAPCVSWTQEKEPSAVLFNGSVILNKFIGGEHDHEIPATKEHLLLGDTIFQAQGTIHTVFVVENLPDCLLLQARVGAGVGVVAAGGVRMGGALNNLALACRLAGVSRVVVAFDRTKPSNEVDVDKAWLAARNGLASCGAEVVRFVWPHGGGYKDFGEWAVLGTSCKHSDWQWRRDVPFCEWCGRSGEEWSESQLEAWAMGLRG